MCPKQIKKKRDRQTHHNIYIIMILILILVIITIIMLTTMAITNSLPTILELTCRFDFNGSMTHSSICNEMLRYPPTVLIAMTVLQVPAVVSAGH